MRFAPAGRVPWTKVVSSLLMVIWASCSRGRTGPVKRRSVGRLWPNRSTSPGPDRLRLGALAPDLDQLARHGDRLLRRHLQRDRDRGACQQDEQR